MKEEQLWGEYVLRSQIQMPEAHQRQNTTQAVRYTSLKEGCKLEIHTWELQIDGNQWHEDGSHNSSRTYNIRKRLESNQKEF